MTISKFVRKAGFAAPLLAVVFVAAGSTTPSYTQAPPAPQKSVGRGWPVPVRLNAFDGFPEDYFVGAVTPWYYVTNAAATGGKVPDGVQPLPRDIFTSKDFYADKELWMDKRYYRCNSPISLDSIWGDYSSAFGPLE